jgi:hypothetical protein
MLLYVPFLSVVLVAGIIVVLPEASLAVQTSVEPGVEEYPLTTIVLVLVLLLGQ